MVERVLKEGLCHPVIRMDETVHRMAGSERLDCVSVATSARIEANSRSKESISRKWIVRTKTAEPIRDTFGERPQLSDESHGSVSLNLVHLAELTSAVL
jgi:hypothetical protein